MLCRSCGSDVSNGARFCANCGASQASGAGERRVVTVLFADIVGFTRMAESLDPEEAKHLVDSCFERLIRDITSFGGVIDKVMGDGLVALFGAPTAHEDDAERAVRAAIRMQNSMRTMAVDSSIALELRVGVNTGEVLVGGSKAGGDYTAIGDVMNTAARLETEARPGEILVGESTQLATIDAVAYRPAGDVAIKGRDGTVEAFVALSTIRPPGTRTRRATSFIGRDAEVELLASQARLAVGGQRAQLAMVLGEPGMGKTRVVEEAARLIAAEHGGRVFEGRCVPYGEANLWWPIADLMRRAWNIDVDLGAEEANQIIVGVLSNELWAERYTDRDRLAQVLMHILGFETPLRGGDRLRNRNEVIYAVTTIISRLLDESPVLLILSDVHWAPLPVRHVLVSVLEELARRDFMVLLTARSGEEPEILAPRCGFVRLHLEPLSKAAAHTMLAHLGVDLPAAALERIVDHSGGNPFFIEELASLVLARRSTGDSSVIDELSSGRLDSVPATLRGLVAARLDALSPQERSLLESASVLGRSASVMALQVMAKETLGSDDISAELESLVRSDLLDITGSRYSFHSDLVRDVTYGTVTKADRARAHAGVAEFLEGRFHPADRSTTAIIIASHYRSAALLSAEVASVDPIGQQHLKERALHWLAEAGAIALAAGEPSDAERLYADALALGPDADRAPELLYGRARAACERHELSRSLDDLAALEKLIDPTSVLAARALVVSGDVERKLNRHESSARLLTEAASRLASFELHAEEARALRLLGLTQMAAGNAEFAQEALTRSRDVAAAAGDLRAEAWAVQSLAFYAFSTGQVEQAAMLLDSAKQSFAATNDNAGLAWTKGIEAWVAFHQGNWDLARDLVEAVLPDTARRGDPWAEGILLSLASALELWSGKAALALDLAQAAQRVAERADDSGLAIEAKALEGRALISLGRISEGTDVLERTHVMAQRYGNKPTERLAIIVNAASAARVGDFERSIRWAKLHDGARSDLSIVGESDLLVSLALANLLQGDVLEAARTLRSSDVEGNNQRYALAVQSLIAAVLHQSDEVERLASELTSSGTYLDKVYALWALALTQFRIGQDQGAAAALGEAHDVLSRTDDRVTPAIHRLVLALVSGADPGPAANMLRAFGIDPAGWQTLFERILAPEQ